MNRVALIISVFCAVAAATSASPGKALTLDVIWVKVDEYGGVSFNEEKARLDQFILQLRAERNWTAYVVAYAGQVSCEGEARTRANRVKRYLIHSGRIKARRIRIIDAGYHQEWFIELYTAPPNAPPLTTKLLVGSVGHLRLDQVEVLRKCKGRIHPDH